MTNVYANESVETAVVLMVSLLMRFALLDVGLAVINFNNLKDAAQQISRVAIMRGKDAADG